jgi:SPP1 family predicted phage head-tail adaptor
MQIDIQQETGSADGYGQVGGTWANVTGLTGIFASMITTGGREYYAAQKLNAETQCVFRFRYMPGITSLMRVKYGSRYFQIISPPNNVNEKFEWILLSCKEVI